MGTDTASEPQLLIAINSWSLHHKHPVEAPGAITAQLDCVSEAGFDAFTWLPDPPELGSGLKERALGYAGFFVAEESGRVGKQIEACLQLGNGPINCFLGRHDTPPEAASELAEAIWAEGERLGARVHVEVHRNTATETPEKLAELIRVSRERYGREPLINFDLSHHALVKHLETEAFENRLWTDLPAFRTSNLWHVRPFNGQHCQLPVSDRRGGFSPEYQAFRPYIKAGLVHWLEGPRPGNALWIVPELGCSLGYDLSCFPDIWEDTVMLARDIQSIWTDLMRHHRSGGHGVLG